jgi:hypothetical protein
MQTGIQRGFRPGDVQENEKGGKPRQPGGVPHRPRREEITGKTG